MRAGAIAILVLLAVVAAAPANAAAAKPKLTVTSLTPHGGKRLEPGERFLITGVVRNRARRRTPALISATLRRRPRGPNRHALGAGAIPRVRAGRRRSFTIKAVAPTLAVGAASRRLVLVACVRPRRGARAACRRSARSVLLVAPTGTGGPGGGGPGGGGPGGGGPGGPGGSPGAGFSAGARSVGDRLFPEIGNGGYDARHYDLALSYDPDTDLLQGTATIDATALQNLSEYSLDLFEMRVSSVLVGGQAASFKQSPGKLIVTPPVGVAAGTAFTTTVTYASPIAAYIDPDGSSEGWVPSSDGAFVVNEPVGAMSWFPNNNVPSDKATYDIRVSVPDSREVQANGRLVSNTANPDGTRTWHWREDSPMASYLVTATNGEFDASDDSTDPAVTSYYAVDSSYAAPVKIAMLGRLQQTPSIVGFFAAFLDTPYPFNAVGGVVDRSSVGYALESQTRPMYANNSGDPVNPTIDTISHELAHQWFGDSVSPATWSDIWLNEGPAEFHSWLWLERENGDPRTTEQRFDTAYADPLMSWDVPPAAPPTAADLFDGDAMYTRGAMVMEALRQIMGEERFRLVLKAYLARYGYAHASTAQFIELVKTESGENPAQLDVFFKEWLYGTERPGITPDNFDTYAP
jgi:aminopeptidase N